MPRKIAEIRILPPLAIARLGSSPYPLVNYDLITPQDTGPRRIVPAPTIRVDQSTGCAEMRTPEGPVKFRDPKGRICPVAPFLELWMRFEGEQNLQPLTIDILQSLGLSAASVRWRGHVENLKILRRTREENDRIEAETPLFSNHHVQPLRGKCKNFLPGKTVGLGSLQYIVPSGELPGIRLRFTPAGGYVYGPPPKTDPLIREALYNAKKGNWKGHLEPPVTSVPHQNMLLTNPGQIFAGETIAPGKPKQTLRSWGYFDDECDGIVEAELLGGSVPAAFARIVAGPPAFAPDSLPIRTVADELEQAMFGPSVDSTTLQEVGDIVRRALETVRLMNTSQMNTQGISRFDSADGIKRAREPIFEPSVADSIAIRARHERILLALESGSLTWFARMLRHYDEVADLSTLGRRKMPGLMRGADGMHLALTRRQASKIRQAAKNSLPRKKVPGA